MAKTDLWMPLYIGDYLADTTHLETEEHGAYLLLLMRCWRDGSLPDDDELLRRFAKLSKHKWKKVSPILREFFSKTDGRLHSKRIDAELEKAEEIRASRSEKASKAARARWGNDDAPSNADGMLGDAQSQSQSPDASKDAPSINPKPDDQDLFGETEQDQETLPAFLDRTDEHKAVEMWNTTAETHGLPMCQKLTDTRRSKLRKRLKDCGGLEGWQMAMDKIGAAGWMHGGNDRGWKADIDFVLQEKSFTRLMEGAYDRTDPPPGSDGGGSIMDAFDQIGGNA